MFEAVLKNELVARASRQVARGSTLRISGIWGSSAPLVAAALSSLTGRAVLYVAAHLDDADAAADDYEVFTGRPAELFPAWEVDVGLEHLNDEVGGERLRVCNMLAQPPAQADRPPFIAAPVMALLQPAPSREALAKAKLTLRKGGTMSPDDLATWLSDSGLSRCEQVDQQGDFARRGGIVDVLCVGWSQPARIEFFGDTIESIRLFDLDTQRSTRETDSIEIIGSSPAHETDPSKLTTLLDYLPDDTIVVICEPAEVMELADELHRRLAPAEQAPHAPAQPLRLMAPADVLPRLARLALVELYAFAPPGDDGGAAHVSLGVRSLERLSLNTHEALAELSELSEVSQVWVYCQNPAEEARFREVLSAQHAALAARARTGIGHVHAGFHWPQAQLVVVGHHEVFHRYAKVRRIRRVRAGRPVESLLDLQEGDYVVHVQHGIARFEGLRSLQREGKSEEYLRLKFADDAVLHVPASGIALVQKYIGAKGKRPSLSHLGGAGWLKTRKRVEAAVTDMAAELLRIQAARDATPGASYPISTDWQRQFEEEFVYQETEDQIITMRQVDDDLFRPRPMDRLLCGDVGYGKTELAMRAAFKVAEAGRQVAVLVPTTVLADQHYRTFTERFADYPIRIDVISRFRTAAQQKDLLLRLAGKELDILIGTHRLLSKDVRFADLGLVVIDEEQRFGVEHKERLKAVRASVDVLTMTATPIPRTLHMALLGLRDISNLTTPPLDRRAIHTEVRHAEDDFIRQAILREMARDGQVFFVHNRVMDIEAQAQHVRALAPEARVEIGHGQMHQGELEKVMLRFIAGKIDVLVCTTIIESGLDIPTANTIIINNADRFGLSELHQLRGRVGRYKHRAFCYLLLPSTRPVTSVAARRLKAVEEFSDLGAGFQIAMRDLEIRGAGNILGSEQSGHIAAVGYELYCQLLDRAVRSLRGDGERPHHDVHLELSSEAIIPRTYVPSERQRMEIYRRLAACRDEPDVRTLERDLADAYGPVPAAVRTLLDHAEIRVRAGAAGIDSIVLMGTDVVFGVRDFHLAQRVFEGVKGSVRMPDDKTVHWRPPPAYLEQPTLLRVLISRLRAPDKKPGRREGR
jgi:transcription-repair coupling factor (superfamily II helicase)